jgi:hypothetical protein
MLIIRYQRNTSDPLLHTCRWSVLTDIAVTRVACVQKKRALRQASKMQINKVRTWQNEEESSARERIVLLLLLAEMRPWQLATRVGRCIALAHTPNQSLSLSLAHCAVPKPVLAKQKPQRAVTNPFVPAMLLRGSYNIKFSLSEHFLLSARSITNISGSSNFLFHSYISSQNYIITPRVWISLGRAARTATDRVLFSVEWKSIPMARPRMNLTQNPRKKTDARFFVKCTCWWCERERARAHCRAWDLRIIEVIAHSAPLVITLIWFISAGWWTMCYSCVTGLLYAGVPLFWTDSWFTPTLVQLERRHLHRDFYAILISVRSGAETCCFSIMLLWKVSLELFYLSCCSEHFVFMWALVTHTILIRSDCSMKFMSWKLLIAA